MEEKTPKQMPRPSPDSARRAGPCEPAAGVREQVRFERIRVLTDPEEDIRLLGVPVGRLWWLGLLAVFPMLVGVLLMSMGLGFSVFFTAAVIGVLIFAIIGWELYVPVMRFIDWWFRPERRGTYVPLAQFTAEVTPASPRTSLLERIRQHSSQSPSSPSGGSVRPVVYTADPPNLLYGANDGFLVRWTEAVRRALQKGVTVQVITWLEPDWDPTALEQEHRSYHKLDPALQELAENRWEMHRLLALYMGRRTVHAIRLLPERPIAAEALEELGRYCSQALSGPGEVQRQDGDGLRALALRQADWSGWFQSEGDGTLELALIWAGEEFSDSLKAQYAASKPITDADAALDADWDIPIWSETENWRLTARPAASVPVTAPKAHASSSPSVSEWEGADAEEDPAFSRRRWILGDERQGRTWPGSDRLTHAEERITEAEPLQDSIATTDMHDPVAGAVSAAEPEKPLDADLENLPFAEPVRKDAPAEGTWILQSHEQRIAEAPARDTPSAVPMWEKEAPEPAPFLSDDRLLKAEDMAAHEWPQESDFFGEAAGGEEVPSSVAFREIEDDDSWQTLVRRKPLPGRRTVRDDGPDDFTLPPPSRPLIVVYSPNSAGKTVVAAELAAALARGGITVGLVDLDTRARTLGGRLNLKSYEAVLSAALDAAISDRIPDGLRIWEKVIVYADSPDAPPLERVTQFRLGRLFEHGSPEVEWWVVDAPREGDLVAPLLRAATVIVLVADPDWSRVQDVRRAYREWSRTKPVLVVVNRWMDRVPGLRHVTPSEIVGVNPAAVIPFDPAIYGSAVTGVPAAAVSASLAARFDELALAVGRAVLSNSTLS